MTGSPSERYLAVFEQGADVAELEAALDRFGIHVEDRYDFIRTLVVTGNEAAILALPQHLSAIQSVERELIPIRPAHP